MLFNVIDTENLEELADKAEPGVLMKWFQSILPDLISFAFSVVLALVVYFIGSRLIKLLVKLVNRSMERHNFDEGVKTFLSSLVKYIAYIMLVVIILGLFGITATSISAAVAAMGVTIGLALQGALSNFAGGVLILVMHPFKIGDYIIEGSGKNEGTVVHINIIYTTLKTLDGRLIQIPNGSLAGTSLTNCSSIEKRMFNETVGISYDADVKKAKKLLLDIAEDIPSVISEDGIQVFVSELADSSVKVGLRFWVPVADYWPVKWATLERIKEVFDEEGVEICYNQLDIHLKNKDM